MYKSIRVCIGLFKLHSHFLKIKFETSFTGETLSSTLAIKVKMQIVHSKINSHFDCLLQHCLQIKTLYLKHYNNFHSSKIFEFETDTDTDDIEIFGMGRGNLYLLCM